MRGEKLAWIVVLSVFPEYCRDRQCETQKAFAPDQDIKTIGFCKDISKEREKQIGQGQTSCPSLAIQLLAVAVIFSSQPW